MGFLDKYISKQVEAKLQPAVEERLKTELEKYKNEQRSYEAAQVGQLYNDWISSIRTINSDIKAGQKRLVARGRDAAKNDPYAKKFLRSLTKNVLGPTGPTFRNKSFDWGKDENNKPIKIYDDLANQKIQEGWKEFCKRDFCTASKRFSFNNLSRIELQTVAADGECFTIKKPIPTKQNKFGFTLGVYETEYVDINLNCELRNGNFIFMGVELDQDLNRVAYYFRKFRFQDQLNGSVNLNDYQRIEAQYVNHLFYPESYYQIRGITWFAPSLIRMHMLNAYEEAILIKARINASAPFVLEPKDANTKDASFGIVGGVKDSSGNIVKGIEVGEPWISPKGYETKFPDTKSPSGQEAPFTKLILYDMAAGLDIGGITLTGDYSNVNYTSSRTALLEERDGWKALQEWFIEDFCEDIFKDWLLYALSFQAVQLPVVKFDKFCQPWFYGRRWAWVDPEKEANAAILTIDNNLDTHENILAEKGLDYEEVMDRRELEVKDLKKRGLYVPPSKTNLPQQPKPVDETSTVPKNGKAKNLVEA